ncbi:MAG: LPXTG cell wall anchor domain-containing protein [Acidipila sp.]|nr:LPXTG cell wall anchor domain-containing protein [Acidipila sp.]
MGFLAEFSGLDDLGAGTGGSVDLTNCSDLYARVQKNGSLIDTALSTGKKKQYVKKWVSNINLRWGQYVKCQQNTGLAPQAMPLSNAVLAMISTGQVPGSKAGTQGAIQTPLANAAAQQLNMTAIPGGGGTVSSSEFQSNTGGSGIPWTTIGIVAAVGIGGYLFLKRRRKGGKVRPHSAKRRVRRAAARLRRRFRRSRR